MIMTSFAKTAYGSGTYLGPTHLPALFFFQERVHWIEKPKWCPSGILCWTIFTSCKHQHHIVSSKGCPSGAHFDHRMTPSTSYSSPCSSQESTRTIFILWFYFVLRLEVSSSVELWMKLFFREDSDYASLLFSSV